jgi:AmmeMemoRadiSam system protein B/AmmeMemoRadiSam system protein A
MPDSSTGILVVLGVLAVAALVVSMAYRAEAPATPAAEAVETEASPTPRATEQDRMQGDITVRESAIAGSWYPDDPGALAREVDGYLDAATPGDCGELPLVLVAPHAGYRYSGAAAGQVFAQIRDCHVRRVWVLAPSHRLPLDGVGLYPVDAFRTPLGDLPTDQAVAERLAENAHFEWLSGGDAGEHALEIELPFLQRALGAFELVPLLLGRITPQQAEAVAEAIRPELGPGDLVVISTDFTHHGGRFGYAPLAGSQDLPAELAELDRGAWELAAALKPQAFYDYVQQTGATICGRAGLLLAATLVPSAARGTELVYTTSGELTGDWSNTVSYLGGRFDGPAWSGSGPQTGVARLVSTETAALLLDLARQSLEHWYEHGELLEVDPEALPPDAHTVLGAFVTLEKGHQLRGCIGEIAARRPAYQAVIARAVDAAIHDPRFHPVDKSELDALTLDISLLGPTRQVPGTRSVIVGRHGVVISHRGRSATYLPQVGPEQGWDRDTMLEYLSRKAGFPASQLPEARVEVYEAQVVREH